MKRNKLQALLSNLEGTYDIIFFEEDLPIVFLFDEDHENEESIRRSFSNAEYLISNANVDLVGVETLYGGKEWSAKKNKYVHHINDDKSSYKEDIKLENRKKELSNHSSALFFKLMSESYSELLIGINSFDMESELVRLFREGVVDNQNFDKHPVNLLRSKHFLKTSFEEYCLKQNKGNIILNCGIDHNSRIKEYVNDNKIYNIFNHKANYIRINTIEIE